MKWQNKNGVKEKWGNNRWSTCPQEVLNSARRAPTKNTILTLPVACNYWIIEKILTNIDKYWQYWPCRLPATKNNLQTLTNINKYRQIFFLQPKYWYVSNEIIVAISHWKRWTLTPFNYQRISAWKYSPWIFVCMKIFAMNIYMGMNIHQKYQHQYVHEYLQDTICPGSTSSGWICCTQEYSRLTPCSCTAALKRKSCWFLHFYIHNDRSGKSQRASVSNFWSCCVARSKYFTDVTLL